jgi:hypothetical protein
MTKQTRISVILAALALAATTAWAQTDAQKAFTAIKNMPGTWEQKMPNGGTLQVTIKVISDGSAVTSEITGMGKENMISVFNMDGPNRLLLTHYCSAGNQPRMQVSASPDGKILTFNFLDATNLATPETGHMQSMVLTLLDDNHHTEEWTFNDHGKELKEIFDLRRKM